MNPTITHAKIFCKRLKEARLAAGLSQKKLGIAAGIDEFVASTRINRYEKGIHEVDINTAQNLAKALNVPLPYFYTIDDQLAFVILHFLKLPCDVRAEILSIITSHGIHQNSSSDTKL
ncbi:helix-turn-helix domain-containing protein [Klebsiella aerogenes]|uniref:helix-turn-helix domain-containing protein n=1 Tax=Klebsiella aerogenes TaxID=548 RepID=UPI00388F2CDB|nr:helix-turn-helix transcriptional regulator [Klebsiella aerogenes]